ncbi:class I SAM-dependent methyltransferase [Actinoallomurus bryophytorum]|uniref:Methyltransferase family protein n=1 Tax=Actinoallomurus bryophytorum TaxID=1490222 RepID=A0A543CJ15_9ACTN|nr:methyltransferase domain-containing protein [Actinoallomurus bryophytorum]TQL97089.1 methyltransferase family protein [Actinoallomurus bryophytorum]
MDTPTVRTLTEVVGDEPGEDQVSKGDGPDRLGPRIGDAIGESLRAAYQVSREPNAAPVSQIVERDDGVVKAALVTNWIAAIDQWPEEDRRALDLLKGKVLDIGAGGGRAAHALQDRGHPVTAMDVSAGAVDVCRQQGIRSVFHGTVDEHAATGARYDSFLLLGANFGLLDSRERAPEFLRALAAMAEPGAVIVGQGNNRTDSTDPEHLAYNRRNLQAGRIAGQRTMRIRYRDMATPWFHYLCLAPRELAQLATGAGWELIDVVDSKNSTAYFATLQLKS